MRSIAERFQAAVRICAGPQSIKQRLAAAWLNELEQVQATELPPQQQRAFEELREAMYVAQPMPNEPAPVASIRKMSAHEAARHSATIVRIATDLLTTRLTAESVVQIATPETTYPDTEDAPRQLN